MRSTLEGLNANALDVALSFGVFTLLVFLLGVWVGQRVLWFDPSDDDDDDDLKVG